MLKDSAKLAGALAIIALFIAALGGWVTNIVILASTFDSITTTEAIVRGIGIFFFPLGAIMGWV